VRAFDEFAALMADKGGRNYGENITIAQHCLLTAAAAEAHGAEDALVAACLLHDVGHWLDDPDDEFGIHSHGELGGDWVAARFPSAVAEPVRQHVAAKRYLCAREPDYHARLSPASRHTLTKQGGPMSPTEASDFEQLSHFRDAVQLRRWEDGFGKLTDVEIPHLTYFHPLLARLETRSVR